MTLKKPLTIGQILEAHTAKNKATITKDDLMKHFSEANEHNVQAIVSTMRLNPELDSTIIGMLVKEIVRLREENKLLIQQVLIGKGDK